MRRAGLGVLCALVGAGLVVGGVSPVWAATQPRPVGESAVVGGFGLGDGLEGSFDEQTGSFGFGLPAGGLSLGWDSRAVGVDRHGLGGGWGFGLSFVHVDGGVTVFPAAGGAYPADESAPSGLAGYPLDDVRFEQATGVLPARDDGARGEVAYAYVLRELGGSTTYFSDTGDPVARMSPSGVRHDWGWARGDAHRLVELIDADGVSTAVTWALERGELVVQPGANLPQSGESWVVRLAHGVVTAAVDPTGARTAIRSDASGLVTEIAGPSGAQTAVQWRSHLDGVARVEEVRTLDAVGTELSSRTWRPVAEQGLSTGWPATPSMPGKRGGAVPFSTVIGDGSTEVASTYNALGSLIRRVTTGTTGSGQVVLKEQAFQYPGTDEHGAPTVRAGALPAHWAMPTSMTATLSDARGAQRSVTEHTEFDEHGRLIARTDRVPANDDPDQLTATTTTYVYDAFDKLVASTVHDGDTTDAPITTTTRYQNTLAGDVAHETITEHPDTPAEHTTERAFEYTPSGELTAVITTNDDGTSDRVVQEYDQNGNLTRDLDGTTFAYDAANRVTSHTTTDGVTTRTEYWADGSRKHLTTVGSSGDQAKTGFYWAGDTLLNDTHTGTDEAGTASYLFGTTRHARTVTTGDGEHTEHDTSYLGTDRHSNTTELTDEHGQITTRYAYTDYGTTTITGPTGDPAAENAAPIVGDATRNPIQYAAGYTDPSGRQHLDTRDYHAATMRFDTPDPAPMLTNYAYAGLNPIMKVDPNGRSEIGDYIINGSLAGVGAVAGVWALFELGLPSLAWGPAAVAWWAVGMVAVIGDFVSTGIAVAELVHDSGLKTFIHDHDREALTVAGIAIGAVAAALGPIATKLKDHYKAARARHNAPVDPVSDSNDEAFVSPSDIESESLEGDYRGYTSGGEPKTGGNVPLKGGAPNSAGKSRTDSSNTVTRHGLDDSSSSDTLESEDEIEQIATTTKYSGLTDDEVFAMFITETEANMAVLGPRFSGRRGLTTLTGLLRNPVASDGTELTQRYVWDCYVSSRYQPLETISARLVRRHPTASPEHQRAIMNITTDITAMRQHFR